ncbi:MAG: glycosyltransferase family 4 protein, partial [Chloroflexi bacterium]|nr:glycosyltransferase family 4 protein [Chloroflexota bacterium]
MTATVVKTFVNNAPLRVLMVTPRFLPLTGGIEMHVYQNARRLVQAGVDVTVLTTDVEQKLPAEETIEGIHARRVAAWPRNRDYYFAPAIGTHLMRGSWDVVHVHSFNTFVAPLAMLAAWRKRVPYVLTFHGGGHSSRLRNAMRKPQLMLLRPCLARAARLITLAEFEIPLYSKRLGLPRDWFVRIPDGSDFVAEVSEAPKPKNGTLIVSVGRLERFKGHQRAIAALPNVLTYRPDVR